MHLFGMEEHLSTTWRKLMGEELLFVAQSGLPVDVAAQHFFVVTLHPTPHGSLAGVGLAIAELDARRLAGRMFDEPEEVISDADITDACSELSNVFASGVPSHITDHPELDLGLPSALSAAQFLDILHTSSIKQSYLAAEGSHRIQVIVFESLALPQTAAGAVPS